ncbi:MAG TPA: 3' terminal RNA ribose 2'-O-methyltransferase Hen1, partial [Ktedonobacteraceae bacterium]|nr:3' terminal RNA ribose 2'-O-methyltransferase Hen1 [Ktedonobacteraceae bacterium]
MLLTITTTLQPATDLGYLLHKNPAHLQSFSLSFGCAHVFYPEASNERCTAALLLDIDTVHLVRGREKAVALDQYVSDRPYVASSFLSVAIAEVFGTALNGRCSQRPELATMPLPLQATLAAVPSRGGEVWLRRLFEPLGYTVTVDAPPLDEQYPEWGSSSYFTVTLEGTCRLSELLTHIYVLIPVLDNNKHYWIGDAEVEKLLKRGQGWLEKHPEREQITQRYLKHRHNLVRDALSRLIVEESDDEAGEVGEAGEADGKEEVTERRIGLHEQRLIAVVTALRDSGAKRVLDLGCGEGKLIKLLLQDKSFTRILGLDVSYRALELARDRLRLERLPTMQRERVSLMHGALTYRDKRLEGYDAAAVVEVIEHLDPPRLAAFERILFEFARPETVVVTTPNAEYNVKFATLAAGKFRHKDHRFEWTRQEFQTWAAQLADR